MINILFTICARAGSKGLKNKNISNFLDYPLSYYTLSAYKLFCEKNTHYNCSLVLNTDSEDLINQIKKTNIDFIYIARTEELAGDRVCKLDVIKDSLLKTQKHYSYIVDLDVTSPLRTVEDIEGVLEILMSNKDADASFSVTSSRRSPYFNQVDKKDNGFYSTVLESNAISRQEVPIVFDMNASIYAYRESFLLNENNKKLFDGKTVIYNMKDTAVLDIDGEEDKELMEIVAKYFYEKYNDYSEIKNFCNKLLI